jgi:hypothetical protein
MSRIIVVATIVLGLMLTGCQTGVRDSDSRFFLPPVGTRVIVHQEIPIPQRWARVYLQDGSLYAKGKYNEYYPNCVFIVAEVSDGSAAIEPDTFEVYDVRWGSQDVLGGLPVMLAGVSIGIGGGGGGFVIGGVSDGGAVFQNYNVIMKLRSERQPGVIELICNAGKDDPDRVEQPTVEQMRQSLGAYASLELPAGPGR